jgi:hypothetical protein
MKTDQEIVDIKAQQIIERAFPPGNATFSSRIGLGWCFLTAELLPSPVL